MKMTAFQRQWQEIAARLGLDVELSAEIRMAGRTMVAPVLLRGYGARKGMVLVAHWDAIRGEAEMLVASGYGYSCLGEPSGRPIDWDSVADMLRDWGRVE